MMTSTSDSKKIVRYVRYSLSGKTSYGMVEGDRVRELRGDIFESAEFTGRKLSLTDLKLLAPCSPSKVIAVGLNYKSHLAGRPAPPDPRVFLKLPTCIVGPEEGIVIPSGANNVHFEGELVVVIGRRAKGVSKAEAPHYIFGVTAGNDVSERDWQKADAQWFRAKASDTFGPLGPAIVQGLDHNDLLVESRLNGVTKQSQRTADLIFDVETLVSYVTRFITLDPGDVIYTGTPGQTERMKPGDIVEVDVEGIGILRNSVAQESSG